MIQSIQKHQKIIQFLMALMFLPLIFGGVTVMSNGDDTAVVAKVGATKITLNEFELEYKDYKDRMRQVMGDAFDESKLDTVAARASYLSGMVDRLVLKEAVKKEHLSVSDQALVKTLVNNPQMPKNAQGGVDMVRYEELLKQQGQTLAGFEAGLRESLSATPIMAVASFNHQVLPLQKDALGVLFSKIQVIEQKKIDSAPYLSGVTVTQEQAKQYYQAHQAEFVRPASFDVEYVQLSTPGLPASYSPTDDELKIALATPNATAEQLNGARQDVQIMKGVLPKIVQLKSMDFAKKVAELSQIAPKDLSVLATKFGGNVQVFTGLTRQNTDNLPEVLKESSVRDALTTSGMAASNAIGDPIAFNSGLVVGRVVKSVAAGLQPFDVVQAEIETKLKQQAVLTTLLDKAKSDIAMMSSAVSIGKPEQVGYLLKRTMSAPTLAQVMGVTAYPQLLVSQDDAGVSIVRVVSAAPSVPVEQAELQQQIAGWHGIGEQLQQNAFLTVLRERYGVKVYVQNLGGERMMGKA